MLTFMNSTKMTDKDKQNHIFQKSKIYIYIYIYLCGITTGHKIVIN